MPNNDTQYADSIRDSARQEAESIQRKIAHLNGTIARQEGTVAKWTAQDFPAFMIKEVEEEITADRSRIKRLEGSLASLEWRTEFMIAYPAHTYGMDYGADAFMDKYLREAIANATGEECDWDTIHEIEDEISFKLDSNLPYENYRADIWAELTDYGKKEGPKFMGKRINKGNIPTHFWACRGSLKDIIFEDLAKATEKITGVKLTKKQLAEIYSSALGLISTIP